MTDRVAWLDNPQIEVRTINGIEYKFDRHHVISSNVYGGSDFLQALERSRLFIQNRPPPL